MLVSESTHVSKVEMHVDRIENNNELQSASKVLIIYTSSYIIIFRLTHPCFVENDVHLNIINLFLLHILSR